MPRGIVAVAVCTWLTPRFLSPVSRSPGTRRLLGSPGIPAGPSRLATSWTQPYMSAAGQSQAGPSPQALSTPGSVYEYLKGSWDLRKDIDYAIGGAAGAWSGVATFTRGDAATADCRSSNGGEGVAHVDKVLRYQEQGTFRLRGRDMAFEAGQRLVYDCGQDPVRVFFVDDPARPDDLRFFHCIEFGQWREGEEGRTDLEGGVGTAAAAHRAGFEHLCVKDLYRGWMEVADKDEFHMSWSVTGPQKDGRIRAVYRRRRAAVVS